MTARAGSRLLIKKGMKEKNYNIKNIHISEVRVGDTILCNDGNIRTVTKEYIKYDSFIGMTIFGDSYHLGTMPVKKIIFL